MTAVTKHYIEYRCPGTMFDEVSKVFVDLTYLTIEWAVERSEGIVQRHGAKPYAFILATSTHEEIQQNGELLKSVPEITATGLHYLDGEVLTLADIPDDDENHILRSKMSNNDWPAVVRTRNSYQHIGRLNTTDIVLKGTEVIARGADYADRALGL